MFYYLGRKQRTAHLYPQPKHATIVEPFAGSAAYSMHQDNWQLDVLLVELDPNTMSVWRYLQTATRSDILTLPDVEPGDRLSSHTTLTEPERWLMRYAINPGSSQRSDVVTKFSRWPAQKTHVAASLYKIRHWRLHEGSYLTSPAIAATWFIDPPYHRSGRFYMTNEVDYAECAAFCRARQGQVIACEQAGATWLPFTDLRPERSTRGTQASELVWIAEDTTVTGIAA